jgi:acetyltransferase
VAIGRWSYGIYLWHFPVNVILADTVSYPHGPGGILLRLLLVLGISIPLGAVTYAWVELPAIRWSQRRRPVDAAPNAASSTTSAQAAAPAPAQPRRVPPGE